MRVLACALLAGLSATVAWAEAGDGKALYEHKATWQESWQAATAALADLEAREAMLLGSLYAGLGLANAGVWHTAYGDYPSRLIVFVSDDEPTMERALAGKTWKDLEGRLKQHVRDYTRRVVPFQPGFQF